MKENWKAELLEKPFGTEAWELYDLDQDPGELFDLADSKPEKLKELIGDWEKYALRYEVVLPDKEIAPSPNEVWGGGGKLRRQ